MECGVWAMPETEYIDFLCRCEGYEERDNDRWMDGEREDDYAEGTETYA